MNEANLRIKVTRINRRWHARLYRDGVVIDEMACDNKQGISWICREMLRWFDKLGGISKWAMNARQNQTPQPDCRVWYQNQLTK